MIIPPENRHQIVEGASPDWATQHVVGTPPAGPADGANYPALLRDAQHNLETHTLFIRRVYYLPNQAAVQYGSRIEIEFSPEVEQVIIHTLEIRRGGEVIDLRAGQTIRVLNREAQMERFVFDGRLLAVLVLNDIRPGDTVDYSYSLQAIKPPLFGRLAGSFHLRGAFAAKAVRYRLVYHPERAIYVQIRNGECSPQTAYTAEGLIECLWQLNDVEVIEIEAQTPFWALPYEWIDYGEFGTWEEVAQAATQLFLQPAEALPPHLAGWVDQVKQSAATEEEFILHIVRYVQDTIRYVAVTIDEHTHKPYDVATILDRNYGDCKDKSTLLCRLLQHAGIDARPALVNSRTRELATRSLPRPGAFDHVIVRLAHENRVQWIDATLTDQGGRLGEIPHPAYGVALVLGDNTVAVETLPASPSAENISWEEFIKVHQRNGVAELRVTRTGTGTAADGIRHSLSTLGLAEIDRRLMVDYQMAYPEVSIHVPATFTDDRNANRITIVHTFLLAHIWRQDPKDYRVNHARFLSMGVQPLIHLPSIAKRKAPYPIAHPLQVRATLEIRLPTGFRPARQQATIGSTAFECKFFKDITGNSARLIFEYTSKKDHVLAKERPGHEQAIHQLAQAANFPVVALDRAIQRGRRHAPTEARFLP